MPIIKLDVENFLGLSQKDLVLDVRSPGEFAHAHIPGAYSLPIFDDEERKVIGTIYKQQSREKAIKKGLEFFGPKMGAIIESVEQLVKMHKEQPGKTGAPRLYVHCWRGGMRSAAIAWLMNLYGFEVYLLNGGYKSYRNMVLHQFEKDYNLQILGGYTGSGKTRTLHQLATENQWIIDLEALAHHKGSAFGGIGQPQQPSQEMFENLLAKALIQFADQGDGKFAWIEDESQRIGILNIPPAFWKTMRKSPVFFLDIPFEERLNYIICEYSNLDKEKLEESITRIQKRLGPLETKTALSCLHDGNLKGCFSILLTYYDKAYDKSLQNRENWQSLTNKIDVSSVDTRVTTEKLLTCQLVKK